MKSRAQLVQSRALVLAITVLDASSWTQQLPPTNAPPIPTTQSEKEHRNTINALFDDHSGLMYKLDEPIPAGHGYGEAIDRARIDAMPVSESEVIIVGRVEKYQSYFSNDHTRIYTEFSVVPEQTLKANAPQSSYTVIVMGGAIRKNDGRIITYRKDTPEFLLPGKRYVLFLNCDPPAFACRALKQWGPADGHPIPINREDVKDARENKSQIIGLSEAEFLAAIRARIDGK
jgi:hypothetical protein